MTRDELRELGPFCRLADHRQGICDCDELCALMNRLVAEERERCARIVEGYANTDDDGNPLTPELGFWVRRGGDAYFAADAEAIATAIRGTPVAPAAAAPEPPEEPHVT